MLICFRSFLEIQPFGFCFTNRLRPLDISVMKQLDKCVNVIPVISKADTLTLEERDAFKKRVSFLTFSKAASWRDGQPA